MLQFIQSLVFLIIMNNNSQNHDLRNESTIEKLSIAFTIFAAPTAIIYFIILVFLDHYWLDRQANNLAKNPDNIKQDCLYFVKNIGVGGRTISSAQQYRLNDIIFDSDSSMGFLKNPPLTTNKIHQFYDDIENHKQSKCYKVAYIHLDYFISKKTYLYDYFGMQ